MTHPLLELQRLGQSPWHDNIRREQLTTGRLARMVADGDITGLTSNPTIFEQAIANSTDYDETIEALARAGRDASAIFDALAIEDIRAAADVFKPVFERTRGEDGYVSIEVAPSFARDTDGTIREARRLWQAVDRPNLMVKIPATVEGLPAIEESLAGGLNINITLIFSLERYEAVMEAYLRALERRVEAGQPVNHLASVASFFVSRVDSLVDRRLEERIRALGEAAGEAADEARALEALMGQAAVANARLAYARFKARFESERFGRLAEHGARLQRPLWASTSTKNPAYPDVYYIEALIGPHTVNTMPPATLAAYKDHGQPEPRLEQGVDEAERVIERLEEFGVRMDEVTDKLERDGVALFARSFDSLLAVVEERRQGVLLRDRTRARLPRGQASQRVEAALDELATAQFSQRLWDKDSTLWKPSDEAHQAEIKIRLGWLDVPSLMQMRVDEMRAFADEVRAAGFTHALLCGMGGSSLAPEVLRETFGVADGYLDLAVLDSTDPAAVQSAELRSNPAETLYIIASKSGSTTEPNAFFKYFWERVSALKGDRAGENFIAITDPNTYMERTAQAHNFRHVFLNPPDIGGRYSALSFFGLVPAALMGIDIGQLLERAQAMARACGPAVPTAQNPGVYLGAVLGALGRGGRDKVTLLASGRLATFGYWVEQLLAESTGKEGVGLVPVEGERLGAEEAYARQRDRVFVHVRLDAGRTENVRLKPTASRLAGRAASAVDALAEAGHPVVELRLRDVYDLGGEFMRWEIATAAAGWLLNINPFDQPNVQAAKDNTVRLLKAYADKGALEADAPALAPADRKFALSLLRHLRQAQRGDYVALMAYFERTPRRERLLRDLQAAIRDRYRVAATVGYGPRFLHSTGQLHKGGANNGVFVQFTAAGVVDAQVPGEPYTFGVLKAAQALGDYEALAARGRRVLRVDLGSNVEAGLRKTLEAIEAGGPPAAKAPRKSAARKTARKASQKAGRKTAARKASAKKSSLKRTTRAPRKGGAKKRASQPNGRGAGKRAGR